MSCTLEMLSDAEPETNLGDGTLAWLMPLPTRAVLPIRSVILPVGGLSDKRDTTLASEISRVSRSFLVMGPPLLIISSNISDYSVIISLSGLMYGTKRCSFKNLQSTPHLVFFGSYWRLMTSYYYLGCRSARLCFKLCMRVELSAATSSVIISSLL